MLKGLNAKVGRIASNVDQHILRVESLDGDRIAEAVPEEFSTSSDGLEEDVRATRVKGVTTAENSQPNEVARVIQERLLEPSRSQRPEDVLLGARSNTCCS